MAAPFPTREDFFAVGARELLARQVGRPPGKRVTATAVYTTGTNVNSALAAAAAMADEVMRHTAIRFNELFMDSADDEALDRLIADHIDADLKRKQPAPSIVMVQCARSIPPSSSAAYTVQAEEIVRTASGVEFRLTEDATFAAGAVTTNLVEAQALLAGTVGNVDAGAIVQFAQAPSQPGITISNVESAAGGADIETSRDYLARAKLARKASKGGVYEAILATALAVPGVKAATVTEVQDSNGDPNGIVQVCIADIAGRANTALVERVKAALVSARCAGIVPSVLRTTALNVQVAYVATVLPGYDRVVLADQLRTATIATVNQLKPGETLQRSMLMALIRSVPGFAVTDGSVTVPSVDLVPAATQTIKTQAGAVTVNGS